jgi:uncharacterized protein YkwD
MYGESSMRKIAVLFSLICCFTLPCRAQEIHIRTIETDMLALINKVRAIYSLPYLEQNYEATRVAQYKCEEMKKLSYADHYSPVHGSPAEMLSRFRIPFKILGENIAAGDYSLWEVLSRWLNEEQGNILYPDYREVGVGYCRDSENSNSYWVLLFIS